MESWAKLADKDRVERVIKALKAKGVHVVFCENRENAKIKFHEIVPKGSSIMNMTSTTLKTLGIEDEILTSGRYKAVRHEFEKAQDKLEKKKLGAAPEWSIGSVHAITEEGSFLIASQSGSQLGAHVYGALNVLWIAGTQKIVKNTDEGIRRIYEYCLPLENERAMKVYGSGSAVNKLLIINEEMNKGRLNLILVNEVLGF